MHIFAMRRQSPLARPLRLFVTGAVMACAACGQPRSTSPENKTEPAWVVRQAAKSRLAIVYVHGIFGDTIDTWKAANGARLFDLVNTVPGVAGQADMLAFGFPSYMFTSGSFDIREAANRLHLRLDHEGVLTYQKIAFVAHSMGGLVVLRELLTHPEVRDRVPVIVFFGTPQEGSDITRVAQYVAGNPALSQMTPADNNALLQTLSDEWNTIPPAQRPHVRCAYEKKATHGIVIVPWSSATRFCEGAPPAIEADHIGIVKAERADSDTVAVVATALKEYVFNKTLEPKLETPDFRVEGGKAVIELSSAVGRQSARLVNAGGASLRFTLADVSDPRLYLWPDDTPKVLLPNTTQNMYLALGIGARATEYQFVLRTDVTPETRVIVRVPDLPRVEAQQAQLIQGASSEIETWLADPVQRKSVVSARADDAQAPALMVRAAHNGVTRVSPELPESGSWVMTAEALKAMNWPGLAARALREAEKVSPSVTQAPAVRRLAAETASLSGNASIFASAATPVLSRAEAAQITDRNLLVATAGVERAAQLASHLQEAPPLRVFGLSLQGDAQKAAGNTDAARQSFQAAAQVRSTPSVARRLASVSRMNGTAIASER